MQPPGSMRIIGIIQWKSPRKTQEKIIVSTRTCFLIKKSNIFLVGFRLELQSRCHQFSSLRSMIITRDGKLPTKYMSILTTSKLKYIKKPPLKRPDTLIDTHPFIFKEFRGRPACTQRAQVDDSLPLSSLTLNSTILLIKSFGSGFSSLNCTEPFELL